MFNNRLLALFIWGVILSSCQKISQPKIVNKMNRYNKEHHQIINYWFRTQMISSGTTSRTDSDRIMPLDLIKMILKYSAQYACIHFNRLGGKCFLSGILNYEVPPIEMQKYKVIGTHQISNSFAGNLQWVGDNMVSLWANSETTLLNVTHHDFSNIPLISIPGGQEDVQAVPQKDELYVLFHGDNTIQKRTYLGVDGEAGENVGDFYVHHINYLPYSTYLGVSSDTTLVVNSCTSNSKYGFVDYRSWKYTQKVLPKKVKGEIRSKIYSIGYGRLVALGGNHIKFWLPKLNQGKLLEHKEVKGLCFQAQMKGVSASKSWLKLWDFSSDNPKMLDELDMSLYGTVSSIGSFDATRFCVGLESGELLFVSTEGGKFKLIHKIQVCKSPIKGIVMTTGKYLLLSINRGKELVLLYNQAPGKTKLSLKEKRNQNIKEKTNIKHNNTKGQQEPSKDSKSNQEKQSKNCIIL